MLVAPSHIGDAVERILRDPRISHHRNHDAHRKGRYSQQRLHQRMPKCDWQYRDKTAGSTHREQRAESHGHGAVNVLMPLQRNGVQMEVMMRLPAVLVVVRVNTDLAEYQRTQQKQSSEDEQRPGGYLEARFPFFRQQHAAEFPQQSGDREYHGMSCGETYREEHYPAEIASRSGAKSRDRRKVIRPEPVQDSREEQNRDQEHRFAEESWIVTSKEQG